MKVEFGHVLEYMTGVFGVGFLVGGDNELVIHIDDKPSFSSHVTEEVVHESLEHDRGITKAKEHDCGFKESFVGNEGSFPLVSILDSDIVVSSVNIKLGEDMGVLKFIDEVGDERKRVGIIGGMFIEVMVFLAEVHFAILLLMKKKGDAWEELEG